MKTKRYWKIRKILLNWIFKLKKIRFTLESRRQSSKEYWSFDRLLLERFVSGVIKGIILATILGLLDKLLLSIGVILVINSNILSDVLIGELGVAGVILGLYCSNISSIYSTRYANAPEKIAIAFQYDRLTVKCLNAISSCIIYGTIILVLPDDFMERITEIFMYQMDKKQSKRLLWKIVHKLLNKMV